jgi:AhpD family alkylhydroperoxidase
MSSLTATHAPARVRLKTSAPNFYKAMLALDDAAATGFTGRLAELVRLRASQINGCVYCLDMHSHDSRGAGESQRRLDQLPGWRESALFEPRERAALGLTESLTLVSERGVADDVYAEAARHFSDEELAALLATIVTINAWNRIAISTRLMPPTSSE